MASTKTLPMKVDDHFDVHNILNHRHIIPYHSRPFMWDADKYINHVSQEIIDHWKADKKLYWLGVVLLYTGGSLPAISDAQHRLTIAFLMILAVSNLLKDSNAEYSSELLSWISEYGRKSVLRTEVPEQDNEVLTKYGWVRYPNIESCYEYDFEALGNLLNGKEPEDTDSESKIYEAYNVIYTILDDNLENEDDYTDFAQYLHSNLIVLRICISEWDLAIKVFNSFNNIKVEVPPNFLLKNRLAQIMGESHSSAIHEVFQKIHAENPKNADQHFHLLVNLYCGRVISKEEYEKHVATLIPSTPTNPLEKFVQINMQLKDVYNAIKQDRFGSIFEKYFASGHEVFTLCLIPFGYVMFQAGKRKEYFDLVRKLIAFGIRTGKAVSFNRLVFQTFLVEHVNKLLSGELRWDQALKLLTDQLSVWLYVSAEKEHCISTLVNEKYEGRKFSRMRGTLLYLVEATDSHESRIDHAKVHIDHIYPRKPGKKLVQLRAGENRHRIGNLTPFMSLGSTEDMMGNVDLGNKAFEVKLPYYQKSNIAMTRELTKYQTTGFLDSQIEERSLEVATLLERLSANDLSLTGRSS